MRLMTLADRPELLCLPLSKVQVVLRESPKASACLSSVRSFCRYGVADLSDFRVLSRAAAGRITVFEGARATWSSL